MSDKKPELTLKGKLELLHTGNMTAQEQVDFLNEILPVGYPNPFSFGNTRIAEPAKLDDDDLIKITPSSGNIAWHALGDILDYADALYKKFIANQAKAKTLLKDYEKLQEHLVSIAAYDTELMKPVATLQTEIKEIQDEADEKIAEKTKTLVDAMEPTLTSRKASVKDEAATRETIQNTLLELYEDTGSKTYSDQLGVMVKTEPEFEDLDAINWLIEHGHHEFLDLKLREFKKLITTKLFPLDFVEKTERPTPSIKGATKPKALPKELK